MLLPQSDAFKTLHARLHSVPPLALLHPNPDPATLGHARTSAAEPSAGGPSQEAPDVSPAAVDGAGASSSGGARDRGPSRSGSRGSDGRVEFGPLLALFRARQQAHAEDEEARRAATHAASSAAAGTSTPADAGASAVMRCPGLQRCLPGWVAREAEAALLPRRKPQRTPALLLQPSLAQVSMQC